MKPVLGNETSIRFLEMNEVSSRSPGAILPTPTPYIDRWPLEHIVMGFIFKKFRSDFNFNYGVICCFGEAEFFPMDWRGRKKFPNPS